MNKKELRKVFHLPALIGNKTFNQKDPRPFELGAVKDHSSAYYHQIKAVTLDVIITPDLRQLAST